MKSSIIKTIAIFLAILFASGLYCFNAFAITDLEQPPGEPPHGLAFQSDAQGTKLVGVAVIEFYGFDAQADVAAGARVVIRLRKGNMLESFFKHVSGPLSDVTEHPELIENMILDEVSPDILNTFFPGEDVEITVKNIEEYDDVQANSIIIRDDPNDTGNSVKCGPNHYYLEAHENCVNGIDDDNDGLVDIFDPDCAKISFFIITDIELAVK